MDKLKYLLNGFGYSDAPDFYSTVFKLLCLPRLGFWALLCSLGGFILDVTGLDAPVLFSFVILLVAEFYTGVKVAILRKGERFKSRKFGRMILKIGVYILILSLLNIFSLKIDIPDLFGFPLNPFRWLYYSVLIAIIFQLVISWLENLGSLGYKETRTIAGFVLRRFNKWFEFDGTKDNGKE